MQAVNADFRLATLEDAKALAELHNAVAQRLTERLGQGYWGKQRSLRSQREKIKASDGNLSRRCTFVLEEQGRLLATVTLSTRPFIRWRKAMWREPDAPALCVFDLAVCQDHQRKGLGKQAMLFAEQLAVDNNLRYVRLDAFANDPASNAFYESLGYERRGELDVNGVALMLFSKMV